MKHDIPVTGPLEVYVELQSGDVHITATETDRATVEVTGSRADSVVVEAKGDRVSVLEPRRTGFLSGRGDLQVAITVPEGSALVGKLGSATVRATGELGSVRLNTGAGDVTLAAVNGPAMLKTGAGDITVESVSNESEIKAGAGTITIGHVRGATQLKTGAGSIGVGEASAPVTLKSGSGDLSVGAASDDATLSAASGDVRIARMTSGRATLRNVSGNVRLGIPQGTPVWTDVSTTTGRIRSTLPPTGAPSEGQDYVEVRARSLSGDIYLEALQSPDAPSTPQPL